MRLRKSQIDTLAERFDERRKVARARDWADGQPGAWVDEQSATAHIPVSEGRETQARFGPHGLVELRTPEGRQYLFDYDQPGRLKEAGLTGDDTYKLTYGEAGQLHEFRRGDTPLLILDRQEAETEVIQAQFADGAVERLEYAQGGLVRAVDGEGGELRLERDEQGMVTAIVDGRGNSTRFERDPDDPLGVTIVGADGVRETWASTDEELTVQVDGQLHGRVSGDDAAERVEFADGHAIEIEWDDDLPLKGRNTDGEVEFRYDGERRVVAERQGAIEILYAYDAEGNLASLRTSDGQEACFSWDGDGLLSRAVDTAGAAFRFEYAPNGVVSKLVFPNGIETRATLQTGPNGMQCAIRAALPGATEPVFEERVQFDARGRAIRQRLDGKDLEFRYDGAGRLTEVSGTTGGILQSFAWDAAGNRVAVGESSATFDACNRILQQGAETFAHDGHGRMTARAGRSSASYAYNGQGHLTTVETANGAVVTFAYDAFGRRIRKTCGSRVTHFLWAGRQLLREWTTEGGRQVERRDYLFVPGEYHPLAVRIDGQLHCYHLDRTGTPLALSDEQGVVVWRAKYDPFGRTVQEKGPVRQPLRHLGQYLDDETGLHYNLFRYYDPLLGRYLTPDPLRFSGGSVNLYVYANGDPVNQRDPDGHLVFLAALAIVAGAALIGGLIGGAISAATAEEGKRGEAFLKGFGWGALAGAVGAAVPIIGAAAGLGTAAIAGIALAADAIIAGVEACSEGGWDVGTFAKSAAISVAVTVGTLGLAKIPAVKRALRTLGNKVAGRGRQAYYKIFPAKLAKDRAAREAAKRKAKEAARKASLRARSERVLREAEDHELRRLETLSNNGRRRYGPAHATVVDPGNLDPGGKPRVFSGRNLGEAFDPDDLHPTLRRRREAYLRDTEAMEGRRTFGDDGPPVDGDPGHHAEVQAVNDALKAREAAGLPADDGALEELVVSVRRVDRRPGRSGAQFGCCTDCRRILTGESGSSSVDFTEGQRAANSRPEGER